MNDPEGQIEAGTNLLLLESEYSATRYLSWS